MTCDIFFNFLDRCFFPHRSRELVSPVCGIFFGKPSLIVLFLHRPGRVRAPPSAFYGDISSLLHLARSLLYHARSLLYHARSLLYHARTLLYFGVSLLYLAIFLQDVACIPDPGGAILEHLAACPD